MAALNTLTIEQIVQNYAAAAQAACQQILDFTEGSINLAYAEALADIAAWLQGIIAYVMTLRWASTSFGSDLDSWMADWDFTRLPANYATGLATFSRFTPTNPGLILVGTQVATYDGLQLFNVYADPTNTAYSASAGGYVIPAQVVGISVPVQALTAGTAGNIAAGTLTMLRSAISGVDTVTNAVPFSNGINAESDPAFRARFKLYIASLSKATVGAIGEAIVSLKQGLQYTIQENQDLNGNTDFGMITVIVDDGSGNIPASVLALASAAVNAVRAAGIRVGVYAATRLNASVQLTLTIKPGFYGPNVRAKVVAAVAAHINGRGLGNSLSFTRIENVAYGVPGVGNVTNVSVNGSTADIVPTYQQTIKCSGVIPS